MKILELKSIRTEMRNIIKPFKILVWSISLSSIFFLAAVEDKFLAFLFKYRVFLKAEKIVFKCCYISLFFFSKNF